MTADATSKTPVWTWVAPFAACLVLAAKFTGLLPPTAWPVIVLAAVTLGGAVFAAVHHAEILALRVGEPFGSIILAVAVTIIEVALIISILLSGAPGSQEIVRDTVFAAVMIVLNGIVGLCLVVGGKRHYVQVFQSDGVGAALAVLATLATFALILPNYTMTVKGPAYSTLQLLFIGFVSLALYALFIFVQTVRHRDYFADIDDGNGSDEHAHAKPSGRVTIVSACLLLVSLVAVVLLAKILSGPMNAAVAAAGLPPGFVGVLIAGIVLLPEGLASVRAASANKLQNSLNLALGSALASIGLTIPTVAVVAVWMGIQLPLGLGPGETVLLILTLGTGILTLGTGRTTVLQGAVHLVIFGVFIFLAAVP